MVVTVPIAASITVPTSFKTTITIITIITITSIIIIIVVVVVIICCVITASFPKKALGNFKTGAN